MLIRSAPGSGDARSPELARRVPWMLAVMALVFALLIARLWQLQIARGEEYFEAARSNVVDERFLPSVRGKILDRNRVPLADNRPAFNLYAVPRRFDAAARARLIELLGLSQDEIARLDQRLAAARKRGSSNRAVMVLEDQGRDRAGLVGQARLELGGAIEVHDEPYRDYPHGQLAAHLIGYMNQPSSAEMAELEKRGYDATEFIGRYGVERKWERYLHGTRGIERYIINARGERMPGAEAEALIEGPRFEPPVAGHDVVLTIDLELQKLAEQAVSVHAAAAVAVVEVETGRVLALVSTPSFDPNVMTGHLTRAEYARLQGDPRRPFVDKTLQQHYPPGSTYKFVVGGAALDGRLVAPTEQLGCPGQHRAGGRTFYCMHTHGAVDFVSAVQRSCNVYFWKLAERTGIDRMAAVARDFGFGEPTGLGLNGEVSGRVPTREYYEKRVGVHTVGHTLNAATGQGDVELTVVQLAMAYAALANGGRLYVPKVVERVESARGELVAEEPPELRRQVSMSPAALAAVRQGMWRVVNAPGGTAHAAAGDAAVAMAGKTGTAQVRNRRKEDQAASPGEWDPRRDHAWFAGWAPAEQPEIAIAVLIEHGGSGGKVAAPAARQIVDGYFMRVKPAHRNVGRHNQPGRRR